MTNLVIDDVQQKKLEQLLREGCSDLNLKVTDQQQQLLLRYLLLLAKWNKAYNLTAIRDVEAMVSRHLLDSLVVALHLEGEYLIDVGTGPGLPGIPLAILFPEKRITLLDSNSKKTRFLFQAKIELGLENIEVIHSRVEQFSPPESLQRSGFDAVLSRAFATLEDMVTWCRHLPHEQGSFLAMKGKYPEEEISQLPKGYKVVETYPLPVPGEEGERHLIKIAAAGETEPN